jgi:hypothetical protein
LKAHRRLLLQKCRGSFRGFFRGQTRIAAALGEVKRGVAEFVRVRRKKLKGFFRLCRGISCRDTVRRATESLLLI